MAKRKGSPSVSTYIREALSEGVEKPAEIVSWVQAKYGVEPTKSNVNQVKVKWGKEKAAGGMSSSGTKPEEPTPKFAGGSQGTGAPKSLGTLADDLLALKGLVQKYGVDELTKLAAVVG